MASTVLDLCFVLWVVLKCSLWLKIWTLENEGVKADLLSKISYVRHSHSHPLKGRSESTPANEGKKHESSLGWDK
jgi:hypothetical protein